MVIDGPSIAASEDQDIHICIYAAFSHLGLFVPSRHLRPGVFRHSLHLAWNTRSRQLCVHTLGADFFDSTHRLALLCVLGLFKQLEQW